MTEQAAERVYCGDVRIHYNPTDKPNFRPTEAQAATIARLARNMSSVDVYPGTFDLPDGWLSFRQTYTSGTTIYGGIGPEGDAHT